MMMVGSYKKSDEGGPSGVVPGETDGTPQGRQATFDGSSWLQQGETALSRGIHLVTNDGAFAIVERSRCESLSVSGY